MRRQHTSRALIALVAWFLSAGVAVAQEVQVQGDRITLGAVLPALVGTELGDLDLGPSPLPGQPLWVRASDVRAALRRAQRDDRGLSIPKRVRVVRPMRVLSAQELETRAREALNALLAPCEVKSLPSLNPQNVAAGEVEVTATATPPRSSGRVPFQLTILQSTTTFTQHAQAVVECPPPVVSAGASLRLVAVVGSVKVSTPGVAAQAGRVGDEIRVTNSITRKSLRARVIDGDSAEVLR